ncbi:MAG TPA: T9SS type A sorting domain-containing protein, partial [Bacteroidales bacterium]
SFSGTLTIGYISQAYRDIQTILTTTATTARVGINCPVGTDWQDEKHSVCRMTFSDTQSAYYCTGFLINNVREDGTPYFQTANHCISTAYEASTLVTYFNYENSTCSGTDASATITLSGATLKATNVYSDFCLLLLNQTPPTSYIPYFAGWDVSSRNPQKGTCIHHPEGTPKCISLDYNAPTTYPYSISWTDDNGKVISTTVANTHWAVQFSVGNVEAGSSGSPLFDDNKHVIGQLHGGDNTESYYGKMSLSWNYSSSTTAQLKAWLDPDATGTTSLEGTYIRIKPKSAFTTALTNVCVGATVNLTDASKYKPTQWNWTISPSSYQYVNGTSDVSKNPQVVFNSEGIYTVSLKATNNYGQDSVTVNDYITAKNNIQVSLSNIPADSVLCGSVVNNYPIKASGALQYSFSIERTDKMNYSINSDSIYLTLKSDIEKAGTFSSWIKVAGNFGTCKSADSALLKVVMQPNNNIENSVRLWPGRSAQYSNQCATTQTNEPHPPFSACYTNNSWCNSTTLLKNTIWFSFLGPTSGRITIDTHGFNDRIAVYDADSYSKIVSGNTYNYTILAANEGRSASDGTSLLENIPVVAGKTYWLQVDGSNGATGDMVIDLLTNSLELFPNPSNGQFDVIISNFNDGVADIEIYSLVGKLMQKSQVQVTNKSNRFSFDMSDFASGMYIVKVNINGSTMKTKLMIVK